MRMNFARSSFATVLLSFFVSTASATCGGGGGGGMGGMAPGGGGGFPQQQVYYVPWKLAKPGDAAAGGLVLYWFPSSQEELQRSSLRVSRPLSLYASQCVAM